MPSGVITGASPIEADLDHMMCPAMSRVCSIGTLLPVDSLLVCLSLVPVSNSTAV